jgi:uncharacterized circularly permuted ATP-grasp superfamily protein
VTAVPLLSGYAPLPGAFDEILAADGPRPPFARVLDALARLTTDELARLQQLAEQALLNQGVTFSVYADNRGTEKIFPFCLIPRLVAAADFAHLERGLEQRLRALGAFLDDVYGDAAHPRRRRDPRRAGARRGRLPADLARGQAAGGVRIHIAGVDLIRDPAGTWQVLEDNLRTPSGVSYVVENRTISKRVIPRHARRRPGPPGRSLPDQAGRDAARGVAAIGRRHHRGGAHAGAVQLGVLRAQLPGPDDGPRAGDRAGPVRRRRRRLLQDHPRAAAVDVIYRRTDETFLDPEVFRPDSVLGVRGLMRAYAAGNVALANAPGNGVADDKAVYPFVPAMIRFYLGEEPLLAQVPTFVCARDDDRRYVVDHLDQLVVKAVDEAGGYGMLMGPQASAAERAEFRARIEATPRRYIAQHRVELSTCPTWIGDRRRLEPRRVDLRPYVLTSPSGPWVLPGGLTRVALVDGSYVVNSSQGGGSKDTWVLKSGGAI